MSQMFAPENAKIDELVPEQLDKIPIEVWKSSDTTFCDLALGSGQHVGGVESRLRSFGHSDKNIQRRVFGFAPSAGALRLARNKYNLVGSYAVEPDPTSKELNMNFDAFVGNPPYGSKTTRDKLWIAFTEYAIEHCVPGGYIAFITPESWMVPGPAFRAITGKRLVYVNTDIKKYFPGVGSTFSAWVLQNVEGDGKIPIDGRVIDTDSMGLIPKDRSLKGLSILNKFFSPIDKFKFRNSGFFNPFNTEHMHMFGKQSKRYCYPILISGADTRWSRVPHSLQNQKKVVIFRSGYLKPTYDKSSGLAQDAYYKLVRSKREGDNLVSILNSKLYTYALTVSKYSGRWVVRVLNSLPYLDYTQSWTDEEIYDYFGLTKAERKHLEAYIA